MFRAVTSRSCSIGRLAGRRIDAGWPVYGIDDRVLDVLEVDLARLEPIARHAQPAGGEEGVLGDEAVGPGLLQDLGMQPHQPLVLAARA